MGGAIGSVGEQFVLGGQGTATLLILFGEEVGGQFVLVYELAFC